MQFAFYIDKYQDKVNIHYGDLSIKDAINSFRISKKPCNILTLNIEKFIDLRKNYSIIYIDSLESLKDKDDKALFDVSKDDVTKVYKRLNYLIKTLFLL